MLIVWAVKPFCNNHRTVRGLLLILSKKMKDDSSSSRPLESGKFALPHKFESGKAQAQEVGGLVALHCPVKFFSGS